MYNGKKNYKKCAMQRNGISGVGEGWLNFRFQVTHAHLLAFPSSSLSLFFTVLFSSPLLGRWMMVIWLRPSECLRKIGWLIKAMLSKRATFSFTFRWVLIIYLLSGVGFFSNLISLSSCACHLVEGGKESVREIEFLTPREDNSILLHR